MAISATESSAQPAGKVFTLGGATLTLEEATTDVGVFFTSMRFNRAANVWNVEVSLTNRSARALKGPFVLLVDSFTGTSGPRQPDDVDESAKAFFDLSGTVLDGELSPGERSLNRTLTLGFTSGAPNLTTRVFVKPAALPAALGLTRTLDDAGQPLPDVQVIESGPLGLVTNRTDPVFGVVTLGQATGAHTWQFSVVGHLPVWRQQTLTTNEVTIVPDPRLVRRRNNVFELTPIAGGQITNTGGAIQINFSPGSVSQNTTATLTPLTGQTLPAFLPLGWSPLQAFCLELASEPAQTATATFTLLGPLANGEAAALARWNPASLQWETLQVITGNGTATLTAAIPGSGAYVVVVGDSAPFAPPAPQVGQALLATGASLPDIASLTATGKVEPSSSPASRVPELVTATATVIISNSAGALPSGMLLRGEVREQYRLSDGTVRHPPQYENFVVGYQRPGDSNAATLHPSFPLRPLLLFGAEELDEATVTMDVLTPTPFVGGVLETNGGLVATEGIRVLAGAGDLASRQAAQLRKLAPTNFTDFSTNGATVVGAFEVSVAGVASGRHLVAQFGPLSTNGVFVLARVLYDLGFYGLQPLERLTSDSLGRLSTTEPLSGERLAGLIGAGQYLLLQLTAPQGLVSGVARNSAGQPAAGMPVSITGQPWLAFSESNGAFRLLAPTGAVEVAVTDLASGDAGLANITVTNTQTTISADASTAPTGPRVIGLTPTNGASAVSRVTPVVVTFSEPLNIGTLVGGGLRLLDASNAVVNASLNLNLAGTVATLLPVDPLAPSTLFTIQLSTNITDLTGFNLEGPATFTFTTESDSLNRVGGQFIIYEPTNGLAPVFGTPGSADPESPVILVNETSGQTATILSKPDGSFTNFIAADVDDFISAVLVNQNGTRTTIPASRQIFRDGSVGLFSGGGILEAESDGGPVQIIVEPGSIENKTRFKLDLVSPADLQTLLKNVQPEGGKVLGGFKLGELGDEPRDELGIAFPVNPADLGLPPGATPEGENYALTIPREFDGVVTYEIINQMHYENGKLVTHSPPFPGVQLRSLSKNMLSSWRKDILQESLVGAFVDFASARGIFFSPIVLPHGGNTVLHGVVVSQRVNNDGEPISGTEKNIAGAVVSVTTDASVQIRQGRLDPGQYTAITDEAGKFALMVPQARLEGSGDVLQATHPRFAHQVAVAALARAGGAESRTAGFRLRFTELNLTLLQTPDVLGPRVTLSHLPVDPAPSTSASAGATIRVTAIDDRDVASLTLSVLSSQPLGAPLPAVNTTGPTELLSTTVGGTGLEKTFRVTSSRRSRVTVQAQAADAAGNLTVASYDVIFAGDIPAPPSVGDTNGPRVVFAWPPNGATGVKVQEPIVLRFSKAIDTNLLSAANIDSWLQFSSGQKPVLAVPSADARQVTINYNGPAGTPVSLTINGQLKDTGGHGLDMDPGSAGNQSFTLTFAQSGQLSANLPAVDSGGGVVLKGAYAYLLDREGGQGKLEIINVSDPANPVPVGSLILPDYPRDLALIPQWTFKLRPGDPPRTANLIAVAGGVVSAPDAEGGTPDGQFLWIVDVSDPAHPQQLASSILTFGIATVPKLKWFPPHLAYLEFGADASAVGLINLQSYLIGLNATTAEAEQFPINGFDGVDTNHDGDFCDTGDQLPLPARNPSGFFGLEYFFAPANNQMITDFDVDPDKALVGVVLKPEPGLLGERGKYVTLYAGTRILDPDLATYKLPSGKVPKRVAVLAGVLMDDPNGTTKTRDLALVSVEGNPSELHVIDISDPLSPQPLTVIPIKSTLGSATYNFGNIQSIQRRADGLVALAAANDVLLLDLRRMLTAPISANGVSAAIVGLIQDAGSGARSFVSDTSGLNLVNLGGKHSVIRTPPFLDIVSFGTNAPFSSASLSAMTDESKSKIWRLQSSPGTLLKARVNTTGGSATPPLPLVHYYLRVDAPGGAGPVLKVAVESLNTAGAPLPNSPFNGVPVRLASTNTLNSLNDTNATVFPRTLQCARLSSDASSEFYNVYLSDPILLNSQSLTPAQVASLLAQEPAGLALIKPDKYLWASLDPEMAGNPVVGVYAAKVVNHRLAPGTAVRKTVEKPRLPLIVVPGVAGSRLGTVGGAPGVAVDDWITLCRSVEDIDLNGGNPGVYATAILRNVVEGPVSNGILIEGPVPTMIYYGPLVDSLINEGGYVLYKDDREEFRRTVAGADYSQQANGPNLFVFPYDWRHDNKQSAAEMAEFVKVAFQFNPDAEAVNIVAHSMGGLVSRRFIIDQATNRVSKFISVDTPYLGAPKLINVMQTGDFAPIPWLETRLMRRLVRFFTGPQQLAPTIYYFQAAGAAGIPMFEYGWDVDNNGNSYGGTFNYAQFKNSFDKVLFPFSRPIAGNETFHTYVSPSGNHQTDWKNDSTGVQNIHIYGLQHAIQTIGVVRHLDHTRGLKPCNNLTIDLADQFLTPAQSLLAHPTNDYSQSELLRMVNHEVELAYVRGDGTVPEVSQTRKNASVDFNDPRARTLTMYGTDKDSDQLTDHNGILRNPGTLQAIRDYLEDIEPVTNAPPAPGIVTMYSVRISDLDPLSLVTKTADADLLPLPFLLPLPVSSLGQCAANIANGLAGRFSATGNGTFEILTEASVPYSVEFHTRGRPFNVVLLRHVDGVIEDRFVFKGITVPSNSVFVVRLDPGGAHVIGVDANGDFEPEINLAPTATLSGNAARDVTPPSVSQTLSGNGVDVLFTATDNGGGQPDVYLIHDTDGDGDLSDEVHLRLPNSQVEVSKITDNNFYVRAEDRSLNLSAPQRIPLNGTPPPACPAFNYDLLGNGLGTQTKLLEAIFKGQQPVSSYGALTNAGIPIFEGYELAVLNEFMALKSGMMLRIVDMTDSNQSDPEKKSPLYRKLRRQLTEVGQAVSRAGLALIIGTPSANNNLNQILFIDQAQFFSFISFEKYIAARAHTTSTIFTGGELTLLDKAAGAAACESATLDALLADDCTANTFLADSLKFIRHAQNILQTPYTSAMQILNDPLHPLFDPAQFAARTAALQKVYNGVQASQIDGLNILKQFVGLDFVVRVFNRGLNEVQNVKVQLVVNNQNQPAFQEVTIPQLTADQVHYIQGDSHATLNVPFSLLEEIPGTGTTPKTAYLLVDPAGLITESDKDDNWYGFRFYILDTDDPCPASIGSLLAVRPPTTTLLKLDPICE